MRRVYAHLMGAVAGFVLIEFFLFSTGIAYSITEFIFNGPSYSWLLILGGFAVVSWLASSVAHRATTPAAQYSAYTALIVTEALASQDKAKRVSVHEGITTTTDGPFAEAKEHLAGFYLLECEDIDRAIERLDPPDPDSARVDLEPSLVTVVLADEHPGRQCVAKCCGEFSLELPDPFGLGLGAQYLPGFELNEAQGEGGV